jgi:hypothetical protein
MPAGAASLPAPTSTLPTGVHVGPQAYVSDSASTAAAIGRFVEALGANGASISAAQAKAEAPQLENSVVQAQRGFQRLSAERIDDGRPEQQRQAVVGPVGAELAQASAIAGSTQDGDAAATVRGLPALKTAMAAVRQRRASESCPAMSWRSDRPHTLLGARPNSPRTACGRRPATRRRRLVEDLDPGDRIGPDDDQPPGGPVLPRLEAGQLGMIATDAPRRTQETRLAACEGDPHCRRGVRP